MQPPDPKNPIIVQGDHTILVEVDNARYAEARDTLSRFAELVKSPEHIHTYRITPLSIWNACAIGDTCEQITNSLVRLAKFPVPPHIEENIRDLAGRFGALTLVREDEMLLLVARDPIIALEVCSHPAVGAYLMNKESPLRFRISPEGRGSLKKALIKLGYPVEDLAGYEVGESLQISLRSISRNGEPCELRPYQEDATAAFHMGGNEKGGAGVVVLPCGAGKTLVGMAAMARLQMSTLILTTGITSARQWKTELLDKTDLREDEIAEFSGLDKHLAPVTIATYQILTHRKNKQEPFVHFALFDLRNWGLIIYDEVHLLPAPVFQITASLQARRRLGLTATLVREDGLEDEVFALIGPKKYDVPWKLIEKQGWIAKAVCTEIRLPMSATRRLEYAIAERRDKFRIASENPDKIRIARQLIELHSDEPLIIIGMYVAQVEDFACELGMPLLTGSTPQRERDAIFERFRKGEIRRLVVSKIANFAVDLPDAAVAIQISGMFGSRQEEAQRLGRILRPKKGKNQAHFYSIVSRDTNEQDYAMNRQLFLCEQGYEYRIVPLENATSSLPNLLEP